MIYNCPSHFHQKNKADVVIVQNDLHPKGEFSLSIPNTLTPYEKTQEVTLSVYSVAHTLTP